MRILRNTVEVCFSFLISPLLQFSHKQANIYLYRILSLFYIRFVYFNLIHWNKRGKKVCTHTHKMWPVSFTIQQLLFQTGTREIQCTKLIIFLVWEKMISYHTNVLIKWCVWRRDDYYKNRRFSDLFVTITFTYNTL